MSVFTILVYIVVMKSRKDIKTNKDLDKLEEDIEQFIGDYDPSNETFPTLRGLYLHLELSKQRISSWKYAKSNILRQAFDSVKNAKDQIVVIILEWMMYHPESKTTGMFYLKSIEKETFNEKIVSFRDQQNERLSNEVDNAVEPVKIVIDLPSEKIAGKKVEYDGKEVK